MPNIESTNNAIAAFDLDGTLTVRDAVKPFLLRCGGYSRAVRLLPKAPTIMWRILKRDRDAVKEIVTRCLLVGVREELILTKSHSFAKEISNGWLREDTMRRLRWHQSQGHVVVIVSASYATYVQPLGELLGVDHVIATELKFEDGICTGELVDGNCRGNEKAVRLKRWASELSGAGTLKYAYGDSSGDKEMLAMADEAFNVKKHELPNWSMTKDLVS